MAPRVARSRLRSSVSLTGLGYEEPAELAYAAFGIWALQAEILRYLHSRPEASTADVTRESRVTRNGAMQNLRDFAETGLVMPHQRTDPGGAGAITYWRGEPEKLDLVVDGLSLHIRGVRNVKSIIGKNVTIVNPEREPEFEAEVAVATRIETS